MKRLKINVDLNELVTDYRRLVQVFNLGQTLKEVLRREAFIREGFKLTVIYHPVGRIPITRWARLGSSEAVYSRSYVKLEFLGMVLEVVQCLKDLGRVTVGSDTKYTVLIPRASLEEDVVEHEPDYLIKLKVVYPWFTKRRVRLILEYDPLLDLSGIPESLIYALKRRRSLSSDLWDALTNRQKIMLIKGTRCYPVQELYFILKRLDSERDEQGSLCFKAGRDVFRYGESVDQALRKTVVDLTVRDLPGRLSLIARTAINKALKGLEWGVQSLVFEALEELEDVYLRIGVHDNPISRLKPLHGSLLYKLWGRTVEDLFIGNYSGTCISIEESRAIHEYIRDPYTHILVIEYNGRRIGHVKTFECLDGGSRVLHVDFIGLASGRFRKIHEDAKLYGVSAAIGLAEKLGVEKVYVAKKALDGLDLKAPLVRNRLVKIGAEVYSQFLDGDKYLVWSCTAAEERVERRSYIATIRAVLNRGKMLWTR